MNALKTCLVSLGSNLPFRGRDKTDTIKFALNTIFSESDEPVKASGLYRTPAWPPGSGPEFINAVAMIRTRKSPEDCIRWLLTIEKRLGRHREPDGRNTRWLPRVIDLDLLDVNGEVLPDLETWRQWRDLPISRQRTDTPKRLILPHPRIEDRAFVVVPLCDVAPDWRHPVSGIPAKTMRESFTEEVLAEIRPLENGTA